MPSEFELIRRYFSKPTPSAVLGPGDDCALLAPSSGSELAISTDMLVEGTHFLPDTDPRQLGWKALAVNLSDLAAMGARPRWALLAGSLPEAREAWLAAFAEGLFACAARYGVELVGGDTTRGPLNLCFTVLGEVPAGQALRRDGAQPGDDLWLSGQPGLAALGLAQLQGKTSLPEVLAQRCLAALQQPTPRVELGLRLRGIAHSAIDVSDGLLADLGHILERSAVAAEVLVGQLPCLPLGADPVLARECQLSGGDDYELVFSAPLSKRPVLAALAAELDLPLWRFGRITGAAAACLTVLDENGQSLPIDGKGFDHFG
ncbi:thiamine-phosphate kinase [Accumulibacter sp.]|uniref:thiamine-phosphate kinase n=1 Tax=Accumulibacter sp. TaxID=2053492 RepID=UPI0028C4E1F6|nr:thiamine-phosphate kinase [Accumulibacter sp.]